MEVAMAATSGARMGRNQESMCSTSRRVDIRGASFADRSRLQYYGRLTYCGKKNKLQKHDLKHASEKKRITLLDGLAKDLSSLSNSLTQSSAAPAVDDTSLADQVRGRIISDALEVVMRQLAQAKAERKDRKRRLKAQKKALKAPKDDSSSESGDSECEVVDVSQVGRSSHPGPQLPAILMENAAPKGLDLEFGVRPCGHIQVCMGPKCRKMGSCQLLSAFEGSVRRNGGSAVEAVGCKCMGKCRNAPNIRVQKDPSHGDHGSNQLHLGVGAADVDLIVSHHFGEQFQGNALLPA